MKPICIEVYPLVKTAQAVMDFDAELHKNLKNTPLLNFHSWPGPTLSYGHFIDPQEHINLENWHLHGGHTAKRSTGGGITLHISDLSFALLIPSTHPLYKTPPSRSYKVVHEALVKALSNLLNPKDFMYGESLHKGRPSFCSAEATRYDLLYRGKKIAGGAQRRHEKGILHHGSLFLETPSIKKLSSFIRSKEKIDDIERNSGYIFSYIEKQDPLLLKKYLLESFTDLLLSEETHS